MFFAIQFGGAYLLRRLMRMMGPVRTVDRVAGVAAAGVWLVIGVTMMLLVASARPFGDPIDGCSVGPGRWNWSPGTSRRQRMP